MIKVDHMGIFEFSMGSRFEIKGFGHSFPVSL
jgi:hypothetical protein